MTDPNDNTKKQVSRHPSWLKVRAPLGKNVHNLKKILSGQGLNTVCQEARCPNMGECWRHGVATFMILGNICTRGCKYCAVTKGKPGPLVENEPSRVAAAVEEIKLSHVVLTSVNRDDLEDGGASVFAETILEIRKRMPECGVEVLVPDFKGSRKSLQIVMDVFPDILNHNIETVPSLFPKVRGGGDYDLSLRVLESALEMNPEVITKSGLMLGLGETDSEIRIVLEDLLSAGVRLLTLGQYLRPAKWHLPVEKYYSPEEFKQWKEIGESLGFVHVESAPLVRSSYLADKQLKILRGRV
ncbi:MAG: lipoyl synthase [Acidobacteriota bacterium]